RLAARAVRGAGACVELRKAGLRLHRAIRAARCELALTGGLRACTALDTGGVGHRVRHATGHIQLDPPLVDDERAVVVRGVPRRCAPLLHLARSAPASE